MSGIEKTRVRAVHTLHYIFNKRGLIGEASAAVFVICPTLQGMRNMLILYKLFSFLQLNLARRQRVVKE